MPGLRPFSFSAGERKIMNHSVVNSLLLPVALCGARRSEANRFLFLPDFSELFEKSSGFVIRINLRLITFVDNIELAHVFLDR
jgi:hypothetical protein